MSYDFSLPLEQQTLTCEFPGIDVSTYSKIIRLRFPDGTSIDLASSGNVGDTSKIEFAIPSGLSQTGNYKYQGTITNISATKHSSINTFSWGGLI